VHSKLSFSFHSVFCFDKFGTSDPEISPIILQKPLITEIFRALKVAVLGISSKKNNMIVVCSIDEAVTAF